MKTPVLLITFNRLDYVKETLSAIAKVKPSKLYIASDGPRPNKMGEDKIVQEIREYILSHIDWPCEIHKRFLETNSGGCKHGVSQAITWFFDHEAEGIILEDDCVANPSFFSYCEELLEKYRDNKKIWHITGESPILLDTESTYYFSKIQLCWGWATWANRWQKYSFDISMYGENEIKKISDKKYIQDYWNDILKKMQRDEIDTWDYQWTFHIIANNGLCINPSKNLISNIGETGVHFDGNHTSLLNKETYFIDKIIHPFHIEVDDNIMDKFYKNRFNLYPQKIIKKYYLFGFIPLFSKEQLDD